MKFLSTALAATALVAMTPMAPAFAAQPAGVTAGMEVVDTNGNAVGTVVSAGNDLITIRTDRHDVPVPVASFTPHEGKLLFAMSAADLNAAVDANLAAAEASVTLGKPVKDVAGVEFGTIDEITDEYIQLALADDKIVRIPVDGLQKDAGGAIALYNAADLIADASDRPVEAMAEAEGEAAVEAGAEAAVEAAAEVDAHAGHDMGAEGAN
ncbi:hypothetical protein [Sphingomicrobium astaxanthinifaciens]|uniref:hypothetical protein n=1 Tax=Sphingomicrobium astaxanthinifaciens TaxID=1227949 RepID=UPI001FCC0F2B|nr:hypothetical protein [Sphingomicrobium astaxanthinifaciens]MCJ7422179.1 hypothetical protein [Sphingomicrobium astaxanthinifaciens]